VVNQGTSHANVEPTFKLNALIVEDKDILPRTAGTREMGEGVLRTASTPHP